MNFSDILEFDRIIEASHETNCISKYLEEIRRSNMEIEKYCNRKIGSKLETLPNLWILHVTYFFWDGYKVINQNNFKFISFEHAICRKSGSFYTVL